MLSIHLCLPPPLNETMIANVMPVIGKDCLSRPSLISGIVMCLLQESEAIIEISLKLSKIYSNQKK